MAIIATDSESCGLLVSSAVAAKLQAWFGEIAALSPSIAARGRNALRLVACADLLLNEVRQLAKKGAGGLPVSTLRSLLAPDPPLESLTTTLE